MKGFLFNVGKDGNISKIFDRGIFGVRLGALGPALYSTLADYSTVKPGDKVFFFQKRLVYGVGEVVDPNQTRRGAFLNYPNSVFHRLYGEEPHLVTSEGLSPNGKNAAIGPNDDPEWARVSVVVPFGPSPYFFESGIDVDEILSTQGFDYAWGLKFNWQRSFVQLGWRETQTLLEIFLRRFKASFGKHGHTGSSKRSLASDSSRIHKEHNPPFMLTKLVAEENNLFIDSNGAIKQEGILHGLLAEELESSSSVLAPMEGLRRLDVFHELPASPGKPPSYIDRMDVVAFDSSIAMPEIPVHVHILEAKKDELPVGGTSVEGHLAQVMKYVDFVARNYTGGNYDAISAYLVSFGFSADFRERADKLARRTYVLDPHEEHPSRTWSDLNLFFYSWDKKTNRLRLKKSH
jgi:hypothetical protein